MTKKKWQQLFSIFMQRFSGTAVTDTSALIAFYLLLSLFPLFIAIGNILPFFNIDPSFVVEYLTLIVPQPVLSFLVPIINSLLSSTSGTLLSVGVIGAVWSSSRGIGYLQKGMNKAYGLPNAGNFIVRRLVSLVTIGLVLLLLIAFALFFSFGVMALDSLAPIIPWAGELLRSIIGLKWPVAILFIFLLLCIVYRITPDVKVRIRDVMPGAAFATVGLLGLVQGFAVYLSFATRSFSSYGALGAFFILMFWLNFSAMIVLVGAVINASISEFRFGKAVEEHGRVDMAIEKTQQSLLSRLSSLFKRDKGAGKSKKNSTPPKEDTPPPEDSPPAE